MQTDVKQVFHFHADANSLGGFVENPFRSIPSPSAASLSSSGGMGTHATPEYKFEDIVHVSHTHTHVFGKPVKRNGPWQQRVVSTVKNFNLLDRITADELVAQIFVVQPEAGKGHRKISFAGSKFVNLKVDGKAVTPVLNAEMLPEHQRTVDAYNQETFFIPEMEWPELAKTAHRKGTKLMQHKGLPGWAHERFNWVAEEASAGSANPWGYTHCSLVDSVDGLTPEQTFGDCIEIPDLGRIFLGGITVHPHAVRLTMVRAELGCKTTGEISAASAGSNATTVPPDAFGG